MYFQEIFENQHKDIEIKFQMHTLCGKLFSFNLCCDIVSIYVLLKAQACKLWFKVVNFKEIIQFKRHRSKIELIFLPSFSTLHADQYATKYTKPTR